MKRHSQFRIVLECIGLLLYCCLMALPYAGLIFLASLAYAIVAVLGFGSASALEFLSVGWKVYVGIAVVSFPIFTTHWFLDSEVGNFRKYLARYGFASVRVDFLAALVWPITWSRMGAEGTAIGNSFAAAVSEVIHYWVVDRHRIKAGKSVAR